MAYTIDEDIMLTTVETLHPEMLDYRNSVEWRREGIHREAPVWEEIGGLGHKHFLAGPGPSHFMAWLLRPATGRGRRPALDIQSGGWAVSGGPTCAHPGWLPSVSRTCIGCQRETRDIGYDAGLESVARQRGDEAGSGSGFGIGALLRSSASWRQKYPALFRVAVREDVREKLIGGAGGWPERDVPRGVVQTFGLALCETCYKVAAYGYPDSVFAEMAFRNDTQNLKWTEEEFFRQLPRAEAQRLLSRKEMEMRERELRRIEAELIGSVEEEFAVPVVFEE